MSYTPIYTLQDPANLGFELKQFGEPAEESQVWRAHRDDHYNFVVFEKGRGSMMIDFAEIQLSSSSLFYILPTQVHSRVRYKKVVGWHLAVDPALIAPECRAVFESSLSQQHPYTLKDTAFNQCHQLLTLLFEKCKEETNPFHIKAVHGILQSFLAIAAACYATEVTTSSKTTRLVQLTRDFKKLLLSDLHLNRSPADYASLLNVSEPYLSEAVKKTTGFPITYWIQQEILLEAKRLLYYSELTVKEIAHTLGYTDHSYFSRIFRKGTGISALAFREQYRK